MDKYWKALKEASVNIHKLCNFGWLTRKHNIKSN